MNGDFAKAFDDYSSYIEKASYGFPEPYNFLLWRVAALRSGKSNETMYNSAKSRFSHDKDGEWPMPAVKLYLGQLTPEELFKASSSKEQECEAYYYVAEYYLSKKQPDKAVKYFKKCLETGVKSFTEYQIAKAELSRRGN